MTYDQAKADVLAYVTPQVGQEISAGALPIRVLWVSGGMVGWQFVDPPATSHTTMQVDWPKVGQRNLEGIIRGLFRL